MCESTGAADAKRNYWPGQEALLASYTHIHTKATYTLEPRCSPHLPHNPFYPPYITFVILGFSNQEQLLVIQLVWLNVLVSTVLLEDYYNFRCSNLVAPMTDDPKHASRRRDLRWMGQTKKTLFYPAGICECHVMRVKREVNIDVLVFLSISPSFPKSKPSCFLWTQKPWRKTHQSTFP